VWLWIICGEAMNEIFDKDKVLEIEFSPECRVNMPSEVILEQVAINIRRGLPQARPYRPNNDVALIVAGGPSLKDTEKQLVEAQWRGGKVVALNGAYQWCIDHNIRPSAMIMLDAREFSARFVETPVENCHYLIAAQAHPRAFELCRDRNLSIWHALSLEEEELALLDEFYFGREHHFPVTMGTTVGMRAISMMRMLGYLRMEIFGLDSCILSNEHHAYAQAENDGEEIVPIWLKPEGRDDLAKRFLCMPWMAKQAYDFIDLVKDRGETLQLQVHGPGLIAEMLRTGAEMSQQES
jgi:6-hydroxymethylpterin diphosphokinase MptE-like